MAPAGKYKFEINEKTKLLWIAGPLFLESLLNVLLHSVDTLMLSHFDEMAVGAVGNVGQILSMMIILFGVISMATSVIVSQYLGAREYGKMNQVYTLGVAVNLVVGAVLSGSVVLLGPQLMAALRVSSEMYPYAISYLRLTGGTMFLVAVNGVMLQILRCNGFTKFGLYISILMNLINIVGNYLFLYGPLKSLDWGVTGVALSTVIARIAALVSALVYFYRNGIGRLALKYIVPFPKKLLATMTKVGLPSAGEQLAYNLYQLCFMVFINMMGNDSVNAKIYSFSLITFTHLFGFAAATATQIIVGHLVGAGKEEEAYRRVFKTLWTSLPITFGLTLVNWVLAPYTLGFFTSNPEVIRIGRALLFVDIFIELGRCLNLTFIFSLRAAGAYVFPLIIGLITMWGVGLPLGYAFGVVAGLGVAGIFIGTAADECSRGLVVAWYWYKRKWLGKKLV